MKKTSKRESSPPLPVKDGISPNKLWLPKGKWVTYLSFLADKFPHIKISSFAERFRNNEIVLQSGKVLTENCLYRSGEHLYFYREIKNETIIPFEEQILYENDRLLVVDKPHFLPVAPSGGYLKETLLTRLRIKTKCDTLELCHRLDRETAGVLLLTKAMKYRDPYHQLFSNREIKKSYYAITKYKRCDFPINKRSSIKNEEASIRMVELKGQPNSETIIDRVDFNNKEQLLKLTPITGKKHQLRVHLASLGMPIKNDKLYPNAEYKEPNDFRYPLQLLAKSLAFVDPIDGSECLYRSRQNLHLR